MSKGQIAAFLLALFGAFVLISIARSVVFETDESRCWLVVANAFPSPSGTYTVFDEVTKCGESKISRMVSLVKEPDQSPVPVIYSSELQIFEWDGYEVSPPPLGVKWVGDRHLSLKVPSEIQYQSDREQQFGEVLVEYREF